ncbi:flagellar filament capping protein FliD [Paenibacillus sp. Soil750]|uniref:flagellar filament capping protein FliD n=1 Tax=Paenibacillus sp. Soil750 TaxID=1736398 RepID=UPI0006F750FD|nr:flagellar filament capping protein FliD [Paenibacillus sp. Soil750]KRE73587.1 hypothetical protein ASL11_06865 [Paenibacillus sp. Soil750]
MTTINRISGMASGLDTDALVKKMMDAESVKLNKMKQNQQKYTWQSDGYRQWNSDLFAFRSNTLFNMKLSSTYSTFSTTTTNADSMSGVATADAIEGTYSYEVSKLAQSATMKSNLVVDQNAALTNTPTNLTLKVTNQAGKQITATVAISATDKMADVITKINGAKDASGNNLEVKAIYDATLKQFILKTKETGANTKIAISADQAGFLDTTLGFAGSAAVDYKNGYNGSAGSYATTTATSGLSNANLAQDAVVKFNGTNVTSANNTVKIMGVNYTLKNVTTTAQSVTIASDIDAEVKNIKDFVSKYNEMLDKLNKAINETVYKDFQPLSDEQRAAMSEDQIKAWESKAKSGLFRNDSSLKELVNTMRNHMTSRVDNGSQYNSLSSIGIASSNYSDKGKLYIDETKLRAAIQADPEAVKNLFSQPYTVTDSAKTGLLVRVFDDFQTAYTKIKDKAGSAGSSQYDQSVIGKLMVKTLKDINNESDRLTGKEKSYYAKFTAMEKYLTAYNSQSSYLTQSLSSNSG